MLTFPAMIVSVFYFCFFEGYLGIQHSFLGIVASFFLFLIPYSIGAMGAGDVKMMMAVGSVLGWKDTLVSVLFITAVGGVFSIFHILYYKNHKYIFHSILSKIILTFSGECRGVSKSFEGVDNKLYIPYGIVITVGVYIFLLYRMIA